MLKRILLSLSLVAAAPFAQAAGFDYNYVEGAYTNFNPDHGGNSLDGPSVDASLALTEDVHAFAGYSHVSCCSVSQNTFDVGAGWNTHLADQVDLFIDGEFLSVNATGNGTDSGWGATGGLRAWLAPMFELDGFVSHTDVSSDTQNTLGVRGLFTLNHDWRLFASVANNSDGNTFMIGARYVF
ncbi:MAG TPA: hypothetical protein VF651_01860 [Gammaproteobacteria bacterium]